MTYCPPNQPQEYEFTALTGADILSANDLELSCGDCFDMPVGATACITVTDNDGSLSGDSHANEVGNDQSWQIADIMVGGNLVHDDAKIYAEEYYVLHGSDGKCYYMIEIEVSGESGSDQDDFYAFYGDVPDAGVTLTVAGKCNVVGNWVDYKCLSAGVCWDPDEDGKITIEAEDMALSGYKVDDMYAASGGEVIRLKKSEGEASMTFGAEDGTYALEVAYVDENDGEGSIEVWIAGVMVHEIELTNNNNGNGNDWSSISKVVIPGLTINQGDEIVFKGNRDCWEMARLDAITFCVDDTPQYEPPEGEVCIEFNDFADGSAALAGDAGSLAFDGVTFEAIRAQDNDGVYNDAMLFDSDAATASGGDSDLLVGKGNLIIISEDGDGSDPDDNAQGGTIVATFDNPSLLTRIMMVDVEETGGTVRLYDADDNLLAEVDVPVVGDGQIRWVELGDVDNVSRMEVSMVGSGAIGAIKFVPGEPTNTPPDALDDTAVTDEATAITLDCLLNDTDPDGDPLVITSAGGVALGETFTVDTTGGRTATVSVNTDGTMEFDPGQEFLNMAVGDVDTFTFSYDISDGNGGTDTANVTVTVNGLNEAPDAVDDTVATTEDAPVTANLLANDTDPNGDALMVTNAGGVAAGVAFTVTTSAGRTANVVVTAAGAMTFTPDEEFQAMGANDTDTFSFTYDITDGNGGADTATTTVTVQGVNDGPTANDDIYTVSESAITNLAILANDTDPENDALTVTLLSSPLEGAITLNADGTVDFDPGTDFLALSDGQSATVTFDYQVSDGEFTDDATVTITVLGEGVCPPHAVVADTQQGTLFDQSPVTITLEGPDATCDDAATIDLSIRFGDTATQYNIVYVVDVSLSTELETIDGIPVIDAQIQALQNLTADILASGVPEDQINITLIPFNGRALPTEPSAESGTVFPSTVFNSASGNLNQQAVDDALTVLEGGGETNYISALFAAGGAIQSQGGMVPGANVENLVYFLTDGTPFVSGDPFPGASQPAPLLAQLAQIYLPTAKIHGIAIGEVIDPSYVNAIDNTGGAAIVRDLDPLTNDGLEALDAALHETAEEPGNILSAVLNVYDNGVLADTINFAAPDFTETPFGFELSADISGIGFQVNDLTTAEMIVELDGNNDQVADDTVTVAVDIQGLLPESLNA